MRQIYKDIYNKIRYFGLEQNELKKIVMTCPEKVVRDKALEKVINDDNFLIKVYFKPEYSNLQPHIYKRIDSQENKKKILSQSKSIPSSVYLIASEDVLRYDLEFKLDCMFKLTSTMLIKEEIKKLSTRKHLEMAEEKMKMICKKERNFINHDYISVLEVINYTKQNILPSVDFILGD